MFGERARQRAAPVEGDARGDAEVRETLASDTESQRILKGLESSQESVRLDHDPRAGRGGAGLLKVADEPIQIDGAAFMRPTDADVRIDHHDGLDVRRQALEQAAHGARVCARLTPSSTQRHPACAQPQHRIVRRAVADEPDTLAIASERLDELLEVVLEVIYRGNDRERRGRDHVPRIRRQDCREIESISSF